MTRTSDGSALMCDRFRRFAVVGLVVYVKLSAPAMSIIAVFRFDHDILDRLTTQVESAAIDGLCRRE